MMSQTLFALVVFAMGPVLPAGQGGAAGAPATTAPAGGTPTTPTTLTPAAPPPPAATPTPAPAPAATSAPPINTTPTPPVEAKPAGSGAAAAAGVGLSPTTAPIAGGTIITAKQAESLTASTSGAADEWKFDFHGFLRTPFRISFGPPSPAAVPPRGQPIPIGAEPPAVNPSGKTPIVRRRR